MKIAWIATSGRDSLKRWHETKHPGLGTTVVSMMEGFRAYPEHEIHVLMAVRRACQPSWRDGNIVYHEVPTPMWGMMKSLYCGSTRALLRKLREIRPDVVHGQGTERECAIPAIFSGLPNVLTIHGNMAELARLQGARPFSFHWLAARLEDFVLPRTDGVFCNSAYTHSLVASRAKKSWMVPNPLMSEFFKPRPESKPYEFPTIIHVGVVSPRKHQVEVLRAAINIHKTIPELRWHFIGPASDDGYSETFQKMVESPVCRRFARHFGRMEYQQIREEMDRCHAMVHFAFEESFGLVVAEGIARGLKMFCANVGGLKDICANVPGVELFSTPDWPGLEEHICSWHEQGASRSECGVSLMRDRYHPKVIAKMHLDIYHELLRADQHR